MEIALLTRIFIMGSIRLQDIDPALTPEEILNLYSANYPHLRNANLAEPVTKDNELHYVIENATSVKTKG